MRPFRWPVLVWREDAALRIIVEDFTCVVDGVSYSVPAGYAEFDGASIPRWMWGSVGHPFMREFECAALIHDYFYDHPEARGRHGLDDRQAVDTLFYRQLMAEGVARAKAKMMYWGVQRFGESRFVCPASRGLLDKSASEREAIERGDCDCAEREVAALLAEPESEDEDAEGQWLREGLALLDFGRIRANLAALDT